MKKLLILKLIFLIVIQTVNAQPISVKQAKSIAIKAFYEKTFARTKIPFQDLEINDHYSKSIANTTYYHAFNFKNGGFIIVAADERVTPVLAYSDRSDCPSVNVSPEFAWWMQSYIQQIDLAIRSNLKATPEVKTEWNRLMKSNASTLIPQELKGVEPMLFTQWNQGAFYNSMCPTDNDGPDNHVLTGCVATALGQLLAYFRHPQQGVGEYSYVDENYGELTVNFAEQSYNYDIMPYKLYSENHEVAKLLYHLGVSVDMNYGPDGSGMTNHKGAYTLYTYFDYADETRYYFRDSVEMDWVDTLINHLDRGIPLYYAGWSDYDFISGHAFICDGYADSTFFHFNWGWGGSYDGYFYLDNLSPGGNDFTLLHEMIANAVPKTNYPHYFSGRKEINAMNGMIDDGSGPIHPYQKDNYTEWLINPQDSMDGIELEFLHFETLENDALTIYDGSTTDDPVLATFSGNEIPATVMGNRSTMLITFTTGQDSATDGFLFKFQCIRPEYCTSVHTISDLNGEITDGSEEYSYLDNTNCKWTFSYDQPVTIEISFTKLDTESENDYVRFYDVTNSTLIGTFSGNQVPETFTVETESLRVFFVSNEEIRNDGFAFNYNVTPLSSKLNTSGSFMLYPNPAGNTIFVHLEENATYCNYKIISINGMQMKTGKLQLSRGSGIINLESLEPGIYILELNTVFFNYHNKLIIK